MPPSAAPEPTQPVHFERMIRLLGLVLVVLGVAVRLRHYLAGPSYWYDEAYLLLNIVDKDFGQLLGPLDLFQVAPPLFLWALRTLYLAAGSTEWAMRFPATTASLVALGLMVPLARRLAGSPGWLWAVGFCALSHHALAHALDVKPYSSDVMVTVAVLLAAAFYLLPDGSPRQRNWAYAGLLAVGLFGPWLSFPSAFILGGASLALLVEACRQRTRTRWLEWTFFNLLMGLSGATLWLVAARYHSSAGLQSVWEAHFLDGASPWSALRWIGHTLIDLGSYGTRGLGLVLVLFAGLGLTVLWMRSPAGVVLLVGPVVLAMTASALRRYPFGDRLLFFAVPCLWLAAAAGIGAVARQFRGRFAYVGVAILALMFLPDTMRTARQLVVVEPRADYREAFAYVHEHWAPGDALWVSHPEVYRAYFGKETSVLGAYYTTPDQVEQAIRGGRLWMVCSPEGADQRIFPRIYERLSIVGSGPRLQQRVKGLEVLLYEPP